MKITTLFLALTFGICVFGIVFIYRQLALENSGPVTASKLITPSVAPLPPEQKPTDRAELDHYQGQLTDSRVQSQVKEIKSGIDKIKDLRKRDPHQD